MFATAILLLHYDHFDDDRIVMAWVVCGGALLLLTLFMAPPCPSCRRNPMVRRLVPALPFPIVFDFVPPKSCRHCGTTFET